MLIKRLFLLINLILITIAVYLCVQVTYAYLASRLDTLPKTTVSRKTVSFIKKTETPSFSNFRSIAQRNLFKTVTGEEKPSSEILLDSLEETRLKLTLQSTVYSDDPENSYAIIEDQKTRKQNLYKVNDTVQQATLKMILVDKVVLSVSGKDEILELDKRSATTSSSSTRIASSSSTSSSTSSLTSSTETTTTSTRRISLTRAQVDSAMENLTELVGQITVKPYSEDGVEGLELSNIKANSIFRRMGLRNGDILTAVEGDPLTNVEQAYKLYEDLKTSDTASLEINRKGRATNYEYRIR